MKVSIEISKTEIKRASYMLMAALKKEKDIETVNEVLAALEKEDNITIPDDALAEQLDQIKLAFAIAAFTVKARDIEQKDKLNQ